MINSRRLVRKNYKCEDCSYTESKLINPIEVNLICKECGGILSEISEKEIKFLKQKKKHSDNSNLDKPKKTQKKKQHEKKTKKERKTYTENNNNNNQRNTRNNDNSSNNNNNHIFSSFPFLSTSLFDHLNNDIEFDSINLNEPFRRNFFYDFSTEFECFIRPTHDIFFDNFFSNYRSNPLFIEIPINLFSSNNTSHPTSNSILNKLKKFPMNDKYCKMDSNGKLELPNCCICISDIQKKENTVLLPCGHMFHWKCCHQWLKNNNTCPVCRFKLTTNN